MLQTVKPELHKLAFRALELSPVDFKITDGLRSLEQQKLYVANGTSKTLVSRHLIGEAIDFVPVPVDWTNLAAFATVAKAFKQAAEELGYSITWGGDWKNFKAYPHIQLEPRQSKSPKESPGQH